MFYVGQDGSESYTDSDLMNYSYGTINTSVFTNEDNSDLAIVKSVVTNLPKIKNISLF